MKRTSCIAIATLLAFLLSSCCLFAEPLFTEKDFKNSQVVFPRADREKHSFLRLTVTYRADKGLTLNIRPEANAHMGYFWTSLPPAKEPKTVMVDTDYASLDGKDVLKISANGKGAYELISLSAERLTDFSKYQPCTLVPSTMREKSSAHAKAKKDYEAAGKDPVILFGDSLTDQWRMDAKRCAYMKEKFGAVFAGICGDTIQDVLWRMQDMAPQLKANPPRVAPFFIGTNNIGLTCSDYDIFCGMKNLVQVLRGYCPQTKIIVFGIPPRAYSWHRHPLPMTANINKLYRTLADYENVFYFDLSPYLLDPKTGDLKMELYNADCLHFSDKGYAEVLTPCFSGMIRLVTAKNLPKDHFRKLDLWERYLRDRMAAAAYNHGAEEYLCCETHLVWLPQFMLNTFRKLEEDPSYTPEMPEEYQRQAHEEGVPDYLK